MPLNLGFQTSLNVYIKMMHMWVDGHVYSECRELWLLVIEPAGTGAPQAVVRRLIGCYEITQVTTSLRCVLNHKTSVAPECHLILTKETCIQGMIVCSWHVTQYLIKLLNSQKTITLNQRYKHIVRTNKRIYNNIYF